MRRRWIFAFLLSTVVVWAQAPHADLLHISDTHLAHLTGAHPALTQARGMHLNSVKKLEEFVATANTMPPATVIHTGDIVDAVCFDAAQGVPLYGQIDAVAGALAKLRQPYHLALGNHDVECYRHDAAKPGPVGDQSVAADARRRWSAAFPQLRRRTYYATRLRVGPTRYRLVMLDNGHSLALPAGRAFFDQQLRWLDRELRRHKRDRFVLALHIPLSAGPGSDELLARLRSAPQIALVLCGHRHTDHLEWLTAGNRQVLQVRTAAMFASAANWRRIRLFADRIEVSQTSAPAQILETVRF